MTYALIINEVLADPPEGLAGDANRDGQYDPHEDEFIELYNIGPVPISLAGWRLGDAGSLSGYFRFPADAVIEPSSYVVLFGGGDPTEFTIPVYTDDGTIGDGLNDSGESIHLRSSPISRGPTINPSSALHPIAVLMSRTKPSRRPRPPSHPDT
ncbi:MAG: lamin tail domain-containing protein [Candidatus Latescibacteria bacterium]|nr:lamin tail domain-containing protein [Candidatus Latescibacterota bacterium]